MTQMVLQTTMALAFVLIIIFIIAFLYKKKSRPSGLISLVSYQSLGQKMGIATLRIGKEILVLGITPNDLKLLKKFEVEPDEPHSPAAEKAKTKGGAGPFSGGPFPFRGGSKIEGNIKKLRRLGEYING